MRTDSLIVCVAVACGIVFISYCTPPRQVTDTLDYSGRLAHCQDVGRDAGTYAAYEACTGEAGL